MTHQEHVNLIKKTFLKKGGIWADFGSGDGAFTLALRDLAGPKATIYSIDKDPNRLNKQKINFSDMFPNTNITFINADFTSLLKLPKLDGIVMANSLHYVKHQIAFLKSIQNYLKPNGKLILVEYSTDTANPWVPYPLSFKTFIQIAQQAGYRKIELLEIIPSTYWNEIYSAIANIKLKDST